jgi:hypothetical protein
LAKDPFILFEKGAPACGMQSGVHAHLVTFCLLVKKTSERLGIYLDFFGEGAFANGFFGKFKFENSPVTPCPTPSVIMKILSLY